MITFVRTRHDYMSYTDFWSLVELSNFPTIYVDELDISKDGVYIVCPMNGEWRPHINEQHKQGKLTNAHLILWNLERPSGSAGSVGEYAKQSRHLQAGLWPDGTDTDEQHGKSYGRFIDDVWHSDRHLAQETGQTFVVLGSDERLTVSGPSEKVYDFCHMSYETDRRKRIYDRLRDARLGKNCWPPERDDILRRSKFALNIHQDNHPYQEPLRFALFAAYGLPIVTESIFDSYPFSEEFMIYAGYDNLAQRIRELLGDSYGQWQQLGMRAKERMCNEFNFKRMVDQAVSESVGWR